MFALLMFQQARNFFLNPPRHLKRLKILMDSIIMFWFAMLLWILIPHTLVRKDLLIQLVESKNSKVNFLEENNFRFTILGLSIGFYFSRSANIFLYLFRHYDFFFFVSVLFIIGYEDVILVEAGSFSTWVR